jgi:type VI secretion system secreted protein VgrG
MASNNSYSEHQKTHFLRWSGAVADKLLLKSLKGKEFISAPFKYELCSLTSASESEIVDWHGKEVSCQIGDGSDSLPQRSLHGVVTGINYHRLTQDKAECVFILEPTVALLRIGQKMRIWQNISVPDIVSTLLGEHGFAKPKLRLQNKYPPREYCVQYRESVLDFMQRILGEEGIYYYFEHTQADHTLVLGDHPLSHSAIQGKSLLWHYLDRTNDKGNVGKWIYNSSLIPTTLSLQGMNLLQAAAIDVIQPTTNTVVDAKTITFEDITCAGERDDVTRQSNKMMSALESNAVCYKASSNAHWLTTGEFFSCDGICDNANDYRIQSQSIYATNDYDENNSRFNCNLTVIPQQSVWQPPFPSQPEIHGILCATVVGPASEEVHTDIFGRIKIQFPWDKANTFDDSSSCWVRVAQPWTGAQYGAQFIPRIGSEVIVSFVNGHPDFPLVTGTLYNGKNRPPFTLPEDKTESGFVTRSMTNASAEEGHRLSFNDKKGEEMLTVIAQRDLSVTVKNDVKNIIAANRATEITRGNEQLHIKEGNRSVELSKGDDLLVLQKGNHDISLNNGDVNITLNKGNMHQKIAGNMINDVSMGDFTLNVSGGGGAIRSDKGFSLESSQKIELKVGNNTLCLSPTGITINGTMIKINASGTAEMKSAMTTLSGSGMTKISGGIINIG